jgi:Methyltransferase FkbM domain
MSSQHGQDLFVIELLGALRGGFFLDSGAADGLRSSNTWMLETSFGWDGICVEPNDEFFVALQKNRRCRTVHCCLHDRTGAAEFLEEARLLGGILDEYHPSVLDYIRDHRRASFDSAGRIRTVSKQTRTVRSVLRECAAPRVIDYWSLDTEGSELSILRSFPFDEYSFRVLTVEHNHLPVRDEIRKLLESQGYQRIGAMGVDDCYLSEEIFRLGRAASWRSNTWSRSRTWRTS